MRAHVVVDHHVVVVERTVDDPMLWHTWVDVVDANVVPC